MVTFLPPPPPKNVGVGIGQPEKVLFQNWKALGYTGGTVYYTCICVRIYNGGLTQVGGDLVTCLGTVWTVPVKSPGAGPLSLSGRP
jgi:hypothetical protein